MGNNTYQWAFGYDLDLRLSDTNVTLVSNNNLLFDQTRTYDAIGNVATANTTVPAGTDNQVFCYDELNRLTWAGSTGTPACSQSLTSGTLTSQGALYQQAYAYDVDNRLTQGPLGSGYTYGDSTHIDAVTSAPNYSASYDAAGDMTARNGQVLSYDLLHRLTSWQNTANNPTQTASYAYDGEGSRVQQTSTASGSSTTTSYIGAFEEVSVTGSTTTTTKYYSAGVAKVTNVNGTLSYLVADDLGSVSEALTSSGGVQATQLYSPYGTARYTSGSMPTNYGYTGQRADPSGLMYYNARYYDPSAGQFLTADTVQGLNRYGYVAGNPETKTDPTGHWDIGSILSAIVAAVAAVARAFTPSHTHSAPSRGNSGGSGSGGSHGRRNFYITGPTHGGGGDAGGVIGSPPKVDGTDAMHSAVLLEFYLFLLDYLAATTNYTSAEIHTMICMECQIRIPQGSGWPRSFFIPDMILYDKPSDEGPQTEGMVWEVKPSRGGNSKAIIPDSNQLASDIIYGAAAGITLTRGTFYMPGDGSDNWGGHLVRTATGNRLSATMLYAGLIQYYIYPPPPSQPAQQCAEEMVTFCGDGGIKIGKIDIPDWIFP